MGWQTWVVCLCLIIAIIKGHRNQWPFMLLLAANVTADIAACTLVYKGEQTLGFYSAWFLVDCILIIVLLKNLIELKWLFSILSFLLSIYLTDAFLLNFMNDLKPISLFINAFAMLVLNFVLLRSLLYKGLFKTENIKHWLLIGNILYFGLAAQSVAALLGTMHTGLNIARIFYNLNNIAYAIWGVLIAIGIVLHKEFKSLPE